MRATREVRLRPSQRVDTRVIYDRETGEVLHIHQAVALPGINFPDENELRASALDVASRTTGKPVEQLDALAVAEDELKPGAHYTVNVQSKCLVTHRSDLTTES